MKTYDEIKAELLEIGDVLKKYPEAIQPQVFEILTRNFLGESINKGQQSTERKITSPKSESQNKKESTGKSKPTGKSKESYSILKELDLRGNGGQSFKDFFEEKNPKSAVEFNSVAVYYLADILKLTGITPNHIYTCYKEVKQRTPEAFVQSLRDAASKHGYIDTANMSDIKIPLRGKNFVEHDLPKKKAKD
jgi:hypothetical protein